MNSNSANSAQRSDQRLGQTYRFNDPDMDLFFVAALGWGPTGGLDIGQAFHVASTIEDGDADTWVSSFSRYAEVQTAQADAWKARGWRRAAGEARLKAFASFRSAWQFAPPGPVFGALVAKQRAAFTAALEELSFPEIAVILDIGEGAAKMRHLRALRRIRALMASDGSEVSP